MRSELEPDCRVERARRVGGHPGDVGGQVLRRDHAGEGEAGDPRIAVEDVDGHRPRAQLARREVGPEGDLGIGAEDQVLLVVERLLEGVGDRTGLLASCTFTFVAVVGDDHRGHDERDGHGDEDDESGDELPQVPASDAPMRSHAVPSARRGRPWSHQRHNNGAVRGGKGREQAARRR